MRYLTYSLLCFISIVFLSCDQNTELNFEEESESFKEIPSDWFYAQRAYPQGKIDKTAFIDALLQKKKNSKTQALSRSDENWEFVGPTNIGGRVTDIEMHASSTEIMYIGTASGGIFKSEDRAVTFTPIFDDALSLSIGDMDIAKTDPDIIYVGTGEANAGGGSLAYDGVGVYRSTDAGDTWTHLGLEGAGSIGAVKIHPTNPNTVFVGTMGNLFADDGQRGLFKTIDGGTTWENVLMISDSTGVIDVAIHPTDPDIIFAATWERIRRPNRRKYAGATSGIFRSDDGGDTWQELTNGLPQAPFLKGRIGLAIAPSQPNIVYAVYAGEDGFISGSFRSTNTGDTWQNFNNTGVQDVPFMWWFGKITVHPQRPDELYYLSLNGFKTENVNNQPWRTFFPGQHADQHALFIHPTDPSLIISGNDGGVYLSNDAGITFNHINTLPITQFYECEIDPTDPDNIYGGSQDNGTNVSRGDASGWQNILGADGFTPIVDPSNNNRVYASIQNGVFFRIEGANSTNITPTLQNGERANWNSPSILDPFDSSTIYFGTSRLLKSENRGGFWRAISSDLSSGPLPNSNLAFGTITTISPSPAQQDLIWIGTDDGNVRYTSDGGITWQSNRAVFRRWITNVTADPQDPQTAYYTTSGYRFGSTVGNVFKTTDMGETFIDISGNLPDVPINDLIVNNDLEQIYIATDIGVYFTTDAGVTWDIFGQGLPEVVVTDLDFHPETNKLLAATYGRSMFAIQVVANPVSTDDISTVNFEANVFPNPSIGLSTLNLEISVSDTYQIQLVDALGRPVKSIYDGHLSEGIMSRNIDISTLPNGVYFYKIQSAQSGSKSIELIKVD